MCLNPHDLPIMASIFCGVANRPGVEWPPQALFGTQGNDLGSLRAMIAWDRAERPRFAFLKWLQPFILDIGVPEMDRLAGVLRLLHGGYARQPCSSNLLTTLSRSAPEIIPYLSVWLWRKAARY